MDISSLNLTIPSPQNHQTTKPPKTLPPGPPRLPLIGNLHQFLFAGDLPTYLWKLSKKHGSIIHLKLGSISAIVVSSPKLAKQVLKIQDSSFCSRPTFLGQQKLSYNNMDMGFSPYGDYWREMRKMTSIHLLSAGKIQSFRPIREEEVSLMIANIGKICDGEREGGVVDLSEMALSLGSSLICRIAFGRGHEDEESKKERRFGESLREAQGVLASLCVSDFFPWLSWVDRLNGYRDWIDATYEKLDVFYQEIIDDHLDPKRKSENENEEDIVDILIKLKEEKSLSVDINIKALLVNIFTGATDTSAAATVWVMTALMKAPQIMNKLQQEIRNLAGKKGRVDEDDLPQLPYLKAVINETFRLYPPIPLLMRQAMQRSTLQGYQIEPKTVIYVNAWAVARDPEYWEDPDKFVPERFLDIDTDVATGQDFGFLPFGAGRRMCPASLMGLVNVELAVANLVYCFDWEMPKGMKVEDIDVESLPGITVHKKIPLLLVPKRSGLA
ncbi:6,7,8-trihydroxycoumarin synthase-like isoform X1 [Salvia hispanica]|uniref:6,7,8-trihydroxycoumarin synthase-like isoform X1 n=1 Tax=Salvia hispanica TaxID=49212 RepID=UPI00200968F8|nr:6,7,8-trihydroxycoumarin synthase-like isoform X1 [Salvia hispanica]